MCYLIFKVNILRKLYICLKWTTVSSTMNIIILKLYVVNTSLVEIWDTGVACCYVLHHLCYRQASQSVTKNCLHTFEQGIQQRRGDMSQVRWPYRPCLPEQWPHQLHLCILWLPSSRHCACPNWSTTNTKGVYHSINFDIVYLLENSSLFYYSLRKF